MSVLPQLKEREMDYKKSMEQILKDKDDVNRQLKLMQEDVGKVNSLQEELERLRKQLKQEQVIYL